MTGMSVDNDSFFTDAWVIIKTSVKETPGFSRGEELAGVTVPLAWRVECMPRILGS